MKKMNSLPLAGIVLSAMTALTMLNGCGGTRGKVEADYARKPETRDAVTVVADTTQAMADDTTLSGSGAPSFGKAPKDVLLIKEGEMDLTVTDLGASGKKFEKWINNEGGYYLQWEQTRQEPQDNYLNVSITVKIPAAQFDSFKDSLETIGTVIDEKLTATDITDDYQQARNGIVSSQYTKDRYSKISEKARGTKDALAVQEKIDDQQGNIDAAQNGIDQIHRQVSMATFTIRMSQWHPLPADPNNAFWHRLMGSLQRGGVLLGDIILFFVGLWPIVGIVAGGVLLWKVYRRRPAKV